MKEGENTAICRCKTRAVVIRDNYWTQWRIVYVIELDEYGRLID